jgi:hypothetical protein
VKLSYLRALEKQAAWLDWTSRVSWRVHPSVSAATNAEILSANATMLDYAAEILRRGETLIMVAPFCSLADHARRTVPDDLEFELSWVPCECGWLYLETPFTLPRLCYDAGERALETHTIRAIGWMPRPQEVSEDEAVVKGLRALPIPSPGSYEFFCYEELLVGYNLWSWFRLQEGEKVLDRLRFFEERCLGDPTGRYQSQQEQDALHEIRWLYTALHLMAQKLAITVQQKTSPLAVSMARKKRRKLNPILKVVTLRRMEQDRHREQGQEHIDREYHWQWLVRGHWRRQPYKDGLGGIVYKNIFIEAYIKGPQDKPLKSPTPTLFVARR